MNVAVEEVATKPVTGAPVRRICIVTGELAGPDYNGGIGTANRGMALSLSRNGFSVDVLYTRVEDGIPYCFKGSFENQVSQFKSSGVSLRSIPHLGRWNDWGDKSYRVLEHLNREPYDLVIFNDTHGNGFYPSLSKRTGNPLLSRTSICVVAHSATQWIQELNQDRLGTVADLVLIEMERRSIELADHLISPSEYMLRKYRGYGWELPKSTHVLPNLMPYANGGTPLQLGALTAVDELVFFGRLERRKGLWLFCNALDRIKAKLVGKAVTFLGKPTLEDGRSTASALVTRAMRWPFEVHILADYDREQALAYLGGGGRVAVMPSLADNSPCVIQECLHLGLPFIASSGSGGEELLSDASRENSLFEPTAESLSRKIVELTQLGAERATPAFDAESAERKVIGWIRDVLNQRGRRRQLPVGSGKTPAGKPFLVGLITDSSLNDDLSAAVARSRAVLSDPRRVAFLASRSRKLDGAQIGHLGPVRILHTHEPGFFADIAQEADTLIIFDAQMLLSADWIERACALLASRSKLGAVAGVAATESEALPAGSSETDGEPTLRGLQTRIGLSSTLLPLSLQTNCGFAAIRATCLPKLLHRSPLYPDGSLKSSTEWIEELFYDLHSQSISVELLPDPVVISNRASASAGRSDKHGTFLRSLVREHINLPAGSDQSLVARLAIESRLEEDRRSAIASSFGETAHRLGVNPSELIDVELSSDNAYTSLSKMAFAAGQVKLSEELLIERVAPDFEKGEQWTFDEIAARRSTEVSLYARLAAGLYDGVNVGHEWSMQLRSKTRTFRLHPNPTHEGRATCVFREVDLSHCTHFRSGISLENDRAHPVRFRIDVFPHNGFAPFHAEAVIRTKDIKSLCFELPGNVLRPCTVILSTEMETPLDTTHDAWSCWIDPMFCGYPPPSGS